MKGDRLQTVCLVILAAMAIALSLYWMKPVLMPFVLALFLSIGLSPLVRLLGEKLRVPHKLAVLLTLVLGVLCLVIVGALVTVSVGQLTDNADEYKTHLSDLLDRGVEALPLERFGIDPDVGMKKLLSGSVEAVGNALLGTTTAVLNLVSKGLLVLIFTCFLLFGGTGKKEPTTGTRGEIISATQRYIVTKVLLSGTTGILVGLILWMLGVDLALVFGVLTFMLNFIPSLGSVIATLLPLPMVVARPDATGVTVALVLLLPGAVQFGIGSVLEPRLMGQSMNLHPITILLALIFWGVLWGVPGMFLAVPMTSVLRILMAKNEITAPVARLLAGKLDSEPAGEPAET